MRYAQISSGLKLHVVCEPGEEYQGEVIRKGYLSAPLCRTPRFRGSYRMTCNLPLAHACQTCIRLARANHTGARHD